MKKRNVVKESVGVYVAKTHFSELIEAVGEGRSITITKHGKAVAEIGPPPADPKLPKRGSGKGKEFYMADDFDAPIEDFGEYQ